MDRQDIKPVHLQVIDQKNWLKKKWCSNKNDTSATWSAKNDRGIPKKGTRVKVISSQQTLTMAKRYPFRCLKKKEKKKKIIKKKTKDKKKTKTRGEKKLPTSAWSHNGHQPLQK